jgi:exonuclease VII large subunit
LSLSTYFITALGHKDNVPLLQKVADKPFITPTALGQYFNHIYNNTIAELQNSKAKLVDDITKQLEGNYGKQIENLISNISSLEKSNQKEVGILTQQLEAAKEEKTAFTNQVQELQKQLEKSRTISIYIILLIIAALVIGCIIGRLL